MIMLKWDYDYYHQQSPAFVFWQDLWPLTGNYASYMTAPSVWRSYFQMTGYLLDNANKRLWIRPRIPTAMGNKIVNAPLPNPKCWGNLNFDGNTTDDSKRTQRVVVSFDSSIAIKEIVLNNNTGTTDPYILVFNNNEAIGEFTCKAEGSGLEKNIRITFDNPVQIGPTGLAAEVYAGQIGVSRSYRSPQKSTLSINTATIAAGRPIRYTTDVAGPVAMDLLSINGAKIGNIMREKSLSSGAHSFVWNGKTIEGKKVATTMVVLRLSSPLGSVSRLIVAELK